MCALKHPFSVLAFCDGVNDCKNHYDETPERCGETFVLGNTVWEHFTMTRDGFHNISAQKAQHTHNARTIVHAPVQTGGEQVKWLQAVSLHGFTEPLSYQVVSYIFPFVLLALYIDIIMRIEWNQ